MEKTTQPPKQARLVVVGAGPAGSLLALLAARAGWTVVLLDRKSFPRPKVCGGCLAPGAIRALHQAQAAEVLAPCRAVPLRRFRLCASGGGLTLPLHAWLAVERTALDYHLLQLACRAGALWYPATEARLGTPSPKARLVHWRQPGGCCGTIAAQLVAVACGLNVQGVGIEPPEFRLRVAESSLIGAGPVSAVSSLPQLPSGQVTMAVGEEGYVGLAPAGSGRFNVAAALHPGSVKCLGTPAAAAACVLRRNGIHLPQLDSCRWQGTPLLTRQVEPAAANRVFLLGDALGYVEPFTGQGIAAAYQQALALWQVLCNGGAPFSVLQQRWTAQAKRMLRNQRFRTGLLALGLRRAAVVRRAVALLNLCPGLAAALVHWMEQAV